MKRGKRQTELDIVADVQERTRQAAALAAIDGQARLADPRTNPATRGRADMLRTEQLTAALEAEHSRLLRRHRVADRRSAEAEETLAAIALARRASSPAASVRELHVGQRLYTRIALTASVVLAAGSAMGVEAAAQEMKAPQGTGYVAEVGLTGLATAAIAYRAHLARHRGELPDGSWQKRTMWALMTVPLLISIAANLYTKNSLGAACAIGAAAFSVLAVVVADRSAAAMQARAAEVSAEDETELERVAMGEDLFAPVAEGQDDVDADSSLGDDGGRRDDSGAAQSRDEAGDDGADVDGGGQEHAEDAAEDDAARVAVAELEAWLQDRAGRPEDGEDGDGGGTRPVRPVPGSGGGGGAARELPAKTGTGAGAGAQTVAGGAGGHIAATGTRQGGHIDSQQDRPAAERVLPATQARLAVGAATRGRIADYLAEHPSASNSRIAAALDLSVATVKRHRRDLRGGGQR